MTRRSGRIGVDAGLHGQQVDGRQGTLQHDHNLALNENQVLAQHEVARKDALAFSHPNQSIGRAFPLASLGAGSFQENTEAAPTARTSQAWLLGLCIAAAAFGTDFT